MLKRILIFLLTTYVRVGVDFFYRKFISVKSSTTMNEGSIIYAPNHQNAFMDALAIVMSQPRTSYFLTQAKVFQSKLGNAFFTSIYMLPIYRERDGLHTVKKNKEIIDQSIDILIEGKQPLTIFPEGNHNLRRSVRPLQKGIARIAFGVLDKNPDTDLKIVPVGINYSAHKLFRSDLFVTYGEPIDVKPFYKDYLEHNNQGYIKLLAEIDKGLRPLTIDMPRGLKYHKVSKSWIQNAYGTFNPQANFKHNQKLVKTIEEEKEIPAKKESDTPMIYKIIFSPLWLILFINNFIGFTLVKTLTKKLAADPAFISSMNLIFGIFLLPFVFMIQAGVILIFTNFLIASIYFLSLPILNWILFRIYNNKFIIE